MGNVLQLKITLNDSHPSIWRRIQIADTSTFFDLHNAIRDAMGWEGSHLHGFAFEPKKTKRPILIGPPSEGSLFETLPEKKELVKDWLGKKSKQCIYTYDYGDNWDHTVLLEELLPPEPGMEYPRCLAGKRACPPEDSGGIWGYERYLEIIKNPKHEEYAETLEWVGDDFDPEEFEPGEVVFDGDIESDLSWDQEDEDEERAPIDNFDDATHELDHTSKAIPFEAIKYLREVKSSKDLNDHIVYVLEHAYDENLIMADNFHDTSPLWYGIVAEKHLDERLITPTVHLLTNTTDDWDFLNEQAQHLICLLAEKYPDETAEATIKAIDAALELKLVSPYLFLFDVFMVVDAKKYEAWLLRLLAHQANAWRAPLAHMLADIQLTSAIPVLEEVVTRMRSGDMSPRSTRMLYDESNDIEEALDILKGTKKPYETHPQPEYKKRGDWEEYYRQFEDRFDDGEDQDDDDMRSVFNKPYIAPPKVGRNEPCPCGSGKKYKKCHGL